MSKNREGLARKARTSPQGRPKYVKGSSGTIEEAVSRFGEAASRKLSNVAAAGHPEDQLRSPIEALLRDVAAILVPGTSLALVGESPLQGMKSRPDFAVTSEDVLVGFIELKAPGKGADARRFRDRHDKQQWSHLKALPNLIYTDGNSFSLWREGSLVGTIVPLHGDIETAGASLTAPAQFSSLVSEFLQWRPIAPKDAKQLAETTAKLCRMLRDEAAEQIALGGRSLKNLAADWRRYFSADASDQEFVDGYAQAVTFGMLMARAQGIDLSHGLARTGQELGPTVIGSALRALHFSGKEEPLSIRTLTRVLSEVDWSAISKGSPDAWLYFYEDFLSIYDSKLRRQTGSYYTPAEVVREMVRLVDELLKDRFHVSEGLASSEVTLADPAVGTGTFIIGALRRIAETVEKDQGEGAVPSAVTAAVSRLVAFESQLGPFSVAQLRVRAEVGALVGGTASVAPRMFVTDTLANPYVEQEWLPQMLSPIAESNKEANRIKTKERIMVVLGNPPYRERAKGEGGWIEEGDVGKDGVKKAIPPLDAWIPPPEWGVSAHAKHLRNLYVYFWRWATWKVFDQERPEHVDNSGIVCFISVAGFLNGPGFQRMREYLRRTTDEVWVIDCSPEGLQPEVSTRIFQGVRHPVCIVLASRSPSTQEQTPAKVRFRSLSQGVPRNEKFEELSRVGLKGHGWKICPSGWREPFLPIGTRTWSSYVPVEQLFAYSGSGVMPGRTWVVAPDSFSLAERWLALQGVDDDEQREELFHPHVIGGRLGDKHCGKESLRGLPGHEHRSISVADDRGECIQPIRYGFRTLDRQWIIPDNRLINRPNPQLWTAHSDRQIYLTGLIQHAPSGGPGMSATSLIPDLHHYKGSVGGRAFPLWLDRDCTTSNLRPGILRYLSTRYAREVGAEDLFAYVAAVTSHRGYTERFREDLQRPGIRVPVTADPAVFAEAAELGRRLLWLYSFGDRFVDPKKGRPRGLPRLPAAESPRVPKAGEIGTTPESFPNELRYSPEEKRLYVGSGYIDRVPEAVWRYAISGKRVLLHWFSYRKQDRERPIMGERRPPSALNAIRPDTWLPEYTAELLNVLHILSLLVKEESKAAALLESICTVETVSLDELDAAQAFELGAHPAKPTDVLELASHFKLTPPEPRRSQRHRRK